MPTLQEGGETHSNVYLTQKSWSRRGFASILYRVSFSRNVSHRSFGSFEVLLQNELKYVKTEIVCVLWLFHRLHRASSESTMWLFVWKTGAFGWINNHSSHSFSTQTDVTHFCSAELNIGNQPTPLLSCFPSPNSVLGLLSDKPPLLLHYPCWGYYRTNLPSFPFPLLILLFCSRIMSTCLYLFCFPYLGWYVYAACSFMDSSIEIARGNLRRVAVYFSYKDPLFYILSIRGYYRSTWKRGSWYTFPKQEKHWSVQIQSQCFLTTKK